MPATLVKLRELPKNQGAKVVLKDVAGREQNSGTATILGIRARVFNMENPQLSIYRSNATQSARVTMKVQRLNGLAGR
jgi:uncharacterized UPF0146 family protein